MSTYTTADPQAKNAFQLKGGLYTLTTLQLSCLDFNQIDDQLHHKIQQAPKFFEYAPMVIDVNALKDQSLDFPALIKTLENNKLIPVGIKTTDLEHAQAAHSFGLAVLQDNSSEKARSNTPIKKEQETEKAAPIPQPSSQAHPSVFAKIIKEPVRSGQQIYARDSDLIVLGSVSQGAEILADGNIHVYGALRGRALAGVTGDETVGIFCQNLVAELVSIAGQYQVSENIPQNCWQHSAVMTLNEGRLQISPL